MKVFSEHLSKQIGQGSWSALVSASRSPISDIYPGRVDTPIQPRPELYLKTAPPIDLLKVNYEH